MLEAIVFLEGLAVTYLVYLLLRSERLRHEQAEQIRHLEREERIRQLEVERTRNQAELDWLRELLADYLRVMASGRAWAPAAPPLVATQAPDGEAAEQAA